MPRKLPSPCAHPGCAALSHGRYCDTHKKQRDKEYDRFNRNQKSKEFYQSKAWKATRDAKMRINPVCEVCEEKPADLVHHKEEVLKEWDKRLDMDNLQSVCHACHNKEHGGRR